MLYKQENITLVDEVRKTGRGNRVWIEILKFLAVLTPINLIMVFAGEAIKAALKDGYRTKDLASFDAKEVLNTTQMGDLIVKYINN